MSASKMTFQGLIHKVIEGGVASINEHEKDPNKREGGLRGFKICAQLDSPDMFEKVINMRRRIEMFMQGYFRTEKQVDKYWKYRYATLQIEYCFEVMKVGIGGYPQLSSRAVMRYADIVGVKEN